MNLTEYISAVLAKKKNIFCEIEIDGSFDKKELKKLCNLKINRKRLVLAWSLIIDFINDNFNQEAHEFLTPEILEFLIGNSICLKDLGHLNLSDEYLRLIYDKDKSCWEALETIKKRQKG